MYSAVILFMHTCSREYLLVLEHISIFTPSLDHTMSLGGAPVVVQVRVNGVMPSLISRLSTTAYSVQYNNGNDVMQMQVYAIIYIRMQSKSVFYTLLIEE